MKEHVLFWDIYEITSQSPIHGVMLRGRIRKFGLQESINLLTENASDKENVVRFAVFHKQNIHTVCDFITTIVPDATIQNVAEHIQNPVLSKMQINDMDRYQI